MLPKLELQHLLKAGQDHSRFRSAYRLTQGRALAAKALLDPIHQPDLGEHPSRLLRAFLQGFMELPPRMCPACSQLNGLVLGITGVCAVPIALDRASEAIQHRFQAFRRPAGVPLVHDLGARSMKQP